MFKSANSATLEEQRRAFSGRPLIAMPLAGTIMWTIIGLSGIFFPDRITVWVLYIGTGSIVYLGLFLSRFTGDNVSFKDEPNTFDHLFLLSTGMSLLVFAIAIPFFMADYSSLPLTVGILTGLMWMPISWIIQHWIGIFHAISRTVFVLASWFLFPELRFVIIPFVIVFIYLISIIVLRKRHQLLTPAV